MATNTPDEKPTSQSIPDAADKPDEEEGIEPEILKKVPPEIRQIMEVGMARIGPMPNPLLQKVTPAHIDKILDLSDKDEERAFQDVRSSRLYTLIYVGIGAGLLLFLTIYLVPIDQQLYREILKDIILVSGGFGAGIGVKTYWDRNRT